MKALISIIEDPHGIVVGAVTDKGDVLLEESEQVPRAALAAVAVTLATKYGVSIPSAQAAVIPVLKPAAEEALAEWESQGA